MFIVVCVRRSSTFVTKDSYIFYMCAEHNKLWCVFSTAIYLVKALSGSSHALGRAHAKVSYIQLRATLEILSKIPLLARALGQKAPSAKRQTRATRANSGIQRISIVNARAIIKYIVYNFKDANEARLMTVNAVS